MMRSMRASAKYIFWALAVAFVAWLALDYSGLVGQRAGSAGDIVGKVNGTEIQLQTFYDAVRQAQEQRRAAGQAAAMTLEEQRQLEDEVFERLVQQVLLTQEYRRRGIEVSDREIVEAARTMPPVELVEFPQFQTEGQFDLEKYQRFLASGADPEFLRALEQRYREELPQIKLFQQLVAGLYVPDAELWQMYRDQHDSVAVRLLHIRPDVAIPDDAVPVTEAEIQAHYRRHRSQFRRAAQAFLSYVALPRILTAADSAAALDRARAIRAELLDGADFAAVARRESGDSASRAAGGMLGWIRRGQTVAPFDAAAFSLRPGVISEIVTTDYGHHIVRVEAAAADSAEVRHILIPVTLTDDRLALVEARADTLDRTAADQVRGELLDSAAAVLRLPVRRAAVQQGQRVLAGGRFVPDAGLWAFTARPDETSEVIETADGYYVFRLDSLWPEGVPPLADARPEAARRVRLEKKRDAARTRAAAVQARLRSGGGLSQAAEAQGFATTETTPFTRLDPAPQLAGQPEVLGAAFGLGVGEVAGPIDTEVGIFFVEVASRKAAERAAWEEQKQAQRARVLQQLRQRRIAEVVQALRASADVVDRRRDIERIQRELAERQPGPLGF